MPDDHYKTKRLILRPWREEDKDVFAKINTDPRVKEFFPELQTQTQSDNLVDKWSQQLAEDGYAFWAVDRIDRNEFIGFVGLSRFEAELPFCPCIEIGWRIAFEHWGNGFATEAASECLTLGLHKFGMKEIVSFTTLANVRSRRVMEKIGMTDTGANFLHPFVDSNSGMQEHCLYRVAACDLTDQGSKFHA